jgi:hypothetical protein
MYRWPNAFSRICSPPEVAARHSPWLHLAYTKHLDWYCSFIGFSGEASPVCGCPSPPGLGGEGAPGHTILLAFNLPT